MRQTFFLTLGAALGLLRIATAPSLGQPAPTLNPLPAEFITRGTTNGITLTGENLGSVTGFLFFGESGVVAVNDPSSTPPAPPRPKPTVGIEAAGISRAEPPPPAQGEKKLSVRFEINAQASLGSREMRVVTPQGVSNPIEVKISQFPEIPEAGNNNSLETAQSISTPATISGIIAASSQIDYYKFRGTKGDEVVIEVDANRRGSPLDSSLTLLTPTGTELARSEDAKGLDSIIVFKVPEEGEFFIQLRDFRYQGGADFKYRLTVGVIPLLDSIFPYGGQRGRSMEVALFGHNLDGTDKMLFEIAPNAPLGRQEIRATTPRGLSNPVSFEVDEIPDFTEKEPNDAIDQADSISIPVAVNGRIGKSGDIDRFKFHAPQDQKIVCEVRAYRFGSSLDPLLILTDAVGNILQQNDDANGPDARIEFDAKKDVDYVLGIRDLTQRGGDSFGYRLTVRPPSAGEVGFSARFLPDRLRIARGGHARIRCEVNRLGGFDGPVRFAFAELPSGIWAEPVTLPNAPASGILVLTALKDATLGSSAIKLMASGTVNGKSVTRVAEPLSGDAVARAGFLTVVDSAPFGVEVDTLSLGIEQGQSAKLEGHVWRRDGWTGDVKVVAEGYAAGRDGFGKSFDSKEVIVKGGESTFRLSLTARLDSELGTRAAIFRAESTEGGSPGQFSEPFPLTITAVPFLISSTLSRLNVAALPPGSSSAAGETATAIKLERRDGFNEPVDVTLEGLPEGVNATLEKLPAGAGETILKLVATDKAIPGTNYTLTVVGTGVHKERNYKTRTGGIRLVVTAPESKVEVTVNTNAPPVIPAK